ncbi:porin, partial [Streptomyces noursei]
MKPAFIAILAVAPVAMAGAAHAQSSVTLYGTIDTSLTRCGSSHRICRGPTFCSHSAPT